MKLGYCRVLAVLLIQIALLPVYGKEYFVAVRGNDQNDGSSRSTAFATVRQGLSGLRPGDVLTIGPGEYYETIKMAFPETGGRPITIRAERSGSAILRGDQPIRQPFEKEASFFFTYGCAVTGAVYGVIERDTLTLYSPVATPDAVERMPGSFFLDSSARRLYVHTTDSALPMQHELSLAGAVGEYGLVIRPGTNQTHVNNVIIEGLAFTGYARHPLDNIRADATRRNGKGLEIYRSKDCVVRGCYAFLNASGIELTGAEQISREQETAFAELRSKDSVIENCTAYGNDDGEGSGAAIMFRGHAENCVIRNCLAFKSGKCIRFYSGVIKDCALLNNIAFEPGDIWVKPNFSVNNQVIGNVCGMFANYGTNNQIKCNMFVSASGPEVALVNTNQNLVVPGLEPSALAGEFADPWHYDYRPQSDAVQTERMPYQSRANIFFVKSDGNDKASGTSVKEAWRTLSKGCSEAKAGDTVYVLAGHYPEVLAPAHSGKKDKELVFRRRGLGAVQVDGIEVDKQSHLRLIGFTIHRRDGVGINLRRGKNLEISQCIVGEGKGNGMVCGEITDLSIKQCLLSGNEWGLELTACENTALAGNIFDKNRSGALKLDKVSQSGLWSDWNSFDFAQANIRVESPSFTDSVCDLSAWREKSNMDAHSIIAVPEYTAPDRGNFYLKNAKIFQGKGPLAMPIGPYELIKQCQAGVARDVKARMVTATTADLEWRTDTMVNSGLRWGDKPECRRSSLALEESLLEFTRSLFHSYSLSGLEPNRRYFFKAISKTPFVTRFTHEELMPDAERLTEQTDVSPPFEFTTAAEHEAPMTYHVAVQGNNTNDGRSAITAWGAINFAAGKVKPGDTVIVHDGEYKEDVVVRATGDKGRQITFKAEHPGRVFLKGGGIIKSAFDILYKNWIVIDGFYITGFARSTPDFSGSLGVVGCSDITIKRCIFDGRPTCGGKSVVVKCARDLTIQNCVFRNGWPELIFLHSGGLTVENNVFYGPTISSIDTHIAPSEKFILTHNIFCDPPPKKRHAALIFCSHLQALRDAYNCFFTRFPETEKQVYGTKDPPPAPLPRTIGRRYITLAEFRRETGQGKTSFFANPGIKILPEYELYKGDMTGRDHPYVTTQEMNHDAKGQLIYAWFDEYFATNALCRDADGRPIGLDQSQFKPE